MTQAIAWFHATAATVMMVYGVKGEDPYMLGAAGIEALVAIANVSTDSPRYKRWRSELVGAYTAGGWPESSWEKDPQTQGPVPPWYRFFVHECADGSHVPIMLRVSINVTFPRDGMGSFTNVKSVVPILINSAPVQAPMPWEVTPDLAAFHKWKHGEVKQIVSNKDGSVTQLVPLDKDQFAVGHLGMTSWKDL